MKKPLLFLASILLWQVGSIVLWLLGNMYIAYAHPDGLSYGKFLLREILFALPDAFLFCISFFLFAGVVVLSPYRKVTGILLVASGLFFGVKGFLTTDNIGSMYLHILINGWSTIMGIMGFFGKSYDETNPPEPPASSPMTTAPPREPLSDEARRKGMRELMSLVQKAQQRKED